MKPKIYIDGQEGTTGLQIVQRLQSRQDIELLTIDSDKRKNVEARQKLMNEADLVFLCLPDAAAVEAVALMEHADTRIIDASTAHRVDPKWTYGFPELGYRQDIRNAKYVANPGCHATGFLSVAAPLTSMGILPRDYPVSAYSLTGYSGGGKKMIAQYEALEKDQALFSPRVYGLSLSHKHLPEMQQKAGLQFKPLFSPIVDDYYKGMTTVLMFPNEILQKDKKEIFHSLEKFYEGEPLVSLELDPEGMLAANTCSGYDSLHITVSGSDSQTLIAAQFDNLGKGASGAAVQNMNLMLGFSETQGLNL